MFIQHKKVNKTCGVLTLASSYAHEAAHSLPSPEGWGNKIGGRNTRKIIGQDKNSLISEGKDKEEKNT